MQSTATPRARDRVVEGEEALGVAVAAPQIIIRRARHRSPDDEAQEEEEPQIEKQGPKRVETREEEEDDDDVVASRREAVRIRLQEEEKERVMAAAGIEGSRGPQNNGQQEEEEVEFEGSSSSYETESDDDDSQDGFIGHRPLAKPVFVPRVSRETLTEREALEREEEEAAEKERVRLEQRKEQTKELVAARLAEEEAQEAAAAAGPRGMADIVTDDELVDEEEEYEAWRLRELKRIARDIEEREREVREAEERERWKAMTEDERQKVLDARRGEGEQTSVKDKKNWKFLQKYYHRGAFFQTEAEYKGEAAPLAGEATQRDFSAPTGADLGDRSALPAVMQVKNFGRRGQTKWTHLVGEDTTDFAAPWGQNEIIRKKMEARRAGTEQVFTKPKNTKT